MDGRHLDLREADPAASLHRGVGSGCAPGAPRPRRSYPFTMGGRTGGRKLAFRQLLRTLCRGVDVLRHADRDPYPARANGAGMGKGPGLALSLPNMLVIRRVMGTKKTLVFVILVVVMATGTGFIFGSIWG